jgi:hypothetical protein
MPHQKARSKHRERARRRARHRNGPAALTDWMWFGCHCGNEVEYPLVWLKSGLVKCCGHCRCRGMDCPACEETRANLEKLYQQVEARATVMLDPQQVSAVQDRL